MAPREPISADLEILDRLEIASRNLAPLLEQGVEVANRWARRPAYVEVAGPLETWTRRCPIVRIPMNPNTRYDVFEHPGSEAAERPARGSVQPLTITSLSTISA